MSFFESVTPLENHRLQIVMSTGNVVVLDLSPKLETIRFWPLKDPGIFRSVTIDGDFLIFGDRLDIAPKVKIGATEVMNLVMLPGV